MTGWSPLASALTVRTLQAKVAFVVSVAGCWLYLYTPDPDWAGRRVLLSLHLQSFLIAVVGPAIAAAAAWDVARARRLNPAAYATATRSEACELGLRAVIGVLWVTLIVVIVGGVAVVRLAGNGIDDDVAWSVVTLGVCVCAIQVAIGVALGAKLWPVPGAAATFGLLYVLAFWQSRQEMWVGARRFFPLLTEQWGPWTSPDLPRILLASAWCGAVAIVTLAVTSMMGERPARPLATMLAAVIVIGVGTAYGSLHPSGESLLGRATAQTERECRQADDFDACVWRVDRSQLPAVVDGIRLARASLAGTVPVPERYLEQFLDDDSGAVVTHFALNDLPMTPTRVAAGLIDDSVPLPADTCARLLNVESLGDYPLYFLLSEVLVRRAGITSAGPEPVRVAADRLLALDRGSQDRWLLRAFAATAACSDPPAIP